MKEKERIAVKEKERRKPRTATETARYGVFNVKWYSLSSKGEKARQKGLF